MSKTRFQRSPKRDLETAVEFYERLGIGPFEDGPSAHTVRREIYGVSRPGVKVRGLLAQAGPNCEPVAGPGIQSEVLGREARVWSTSVPTPTT